MAHELRTPAIGVVAALDGLRQTELTPTQRERLETAHAAARHLLDVVSWMTRAKNGETSVPDELSPRVLLEEIASLLRGIAPATRIDVRVGPSKCEGTVTIGRAIEAVARGDSFLSEVCKRALQRGSYGLSPRETEVLRCVGRGLTNKDIAAKLGLAVRTVESHRERLMTKLDAHNAADLTRAAVARGLVGRD